MKYKNNIKDVGALQPDYLGFIFYDKSKRFFNYDIPDLPKEIKKVGVFVNHTIKDIIAMVNTHKLQTVQLHGQESPRFCKQLQSLKLETIKVFSVKDEFDFSVLEKYEDVCDYFLFDTKGKLPGGNGYTFNWEILKDYPSKKPFFLSGGIGLNEINKLKAFKNTKVFSYCYAIDVNSQFEIEAGLKNIQLLKEFKSQL